MVMVSCPLNLWWCPASSENRGMVRENRDRAGEERQPRENEQWDEKSQGNEGNEGISETEWGEWEGNLRNRMRETDWEGHEKPNERNGLTGEWETEWDGNDSGMKPNEKRNRMMMRWCL